MNLGRWSSIACIAIFAAFGANMALGAGIPRTVPGSGNGISSRPDGAEGHITDVIAITRVYADGWKVAAIAVKYDRDIDPASLSPSDYVVKTDEPTQKIIGVYTSSDAKSFARSGRSGPYVVLELSTDYQNPVRTGRDWTPRPRHPGEPQGHPPSPKIDLAQVPDVVLKAGNISWNPALHADILVASKSGGAGASVTVTQVGDIKTAGGMTIAPSSGPKTNYYVRNLIVDAFLKPDYHDAKNGNLKYSIYFPAGYDPTKKYPVVVFLVDSNSVNRGAHSDALTEGLGAVVWADKRSEARHPAIVVAPLPMGGPLVNDRDEPAQGQAPGGGPSNLYLSTLDLMDYLVQQVPAIDTSRIYLTGQGDGARAALRMMSDRPDLFAAALLFAPDYDSTRIAKLAKAHLWIVSAEADSASYPSMKRCIDRLEKAGAHVDKAEWSGDETVAQYASGVRSMIAQGGNIQYSVLRKGTVVPAGVPADALHIHAYTWRIGYSIAPLRDWLFTQKK